MRCDRRTFLAIAAQLPALAAAHSLHAATRATLDARWIHAETRNTPLGVLGHIRSALDGQAAPAKSLGARPSLPLQRAPWIDGPPLAQLLRASAPAARDPSATELARVLHLANGVTGVRGSGADATRLRAAPSAGALYSNEIYVAVERVTGLAPGLYFYDALGDALITLRSGSQRTALAAALESPSLAVEAACVVLHTNVFGRYTGRYADRGYRYALIDTGHIAENLELAALAGSIPSKRVTRFDDDALHALLDIDGRSEAVCALSALGGAEPNGPAQAPGRLVEKQSVRPPSSGRAIERFHEATKLVRAKPHAEAPAHCEAAFANVTRLGPTRSAGLTPSLPVDRAILERRSAQDFDDAPIDPAQLAFVADAALSRSAGARGLVELLVIVHRVREMEAGLHAYDADTGVFRSLRAGDLRDELAASCLGQRLAADAAAACFILGDLAAIDARCGARGYRDALIESGRIAERIYLAAGALGLRARNLAAFTDDSLNGLLGLDGEPRAALHLIVFGR